MTPFADIGSDTRGIFDTIIEKCAVIDLQVAVADADCASSRHQLAGLVVPNGDGIEIDAATIAKNGSAFSSYNVPTLERKGFKPECSERRNIEKSDVAPCCGLNDQSRRVAAGNQDAGLNVKG